MRKPFQLAMTCTALAATMLSGCKAREMGVAFSDTQSKHVDDSWLVAAKSCWPVLGHSGLSDQAIKANLADPLHFRNAFGVYAYLRDDQVLQAVAAPVFEAPDPDSTVLKGAATPYLTRAQATAGSAPDAQTSSSGEPPTDALCAIHPGTPIGFK